MLRYNFVPFVVSGEFRITYQQCETVHWLAKEIFKKGFPAITHIEVSHPARPQSLMEIQPIAVLP